MRILMRAYNGNQLIKVEETSANPALSMSMDFRNGADQATEYTYDANGNQIKDLNKGITDTEYNLLNLPRRITFNQTGSPVNEYVYSATGAKLSVTHRKSSTPKQTDYVGNMIYENGVLKRILVGGGYIEDGIYHFYIQDHLGNNRVVARQDGTPVQTNHYYPFGMSFAEGTYPDKQPYKYNGCELDQMNGLNVTDLGNRGLHHDTNQFRTMDRFAEKFPWQSPYVHAANNPVNYVDVNGDSIWYTRQDNVVTMHVRGKVIDDSSDDINVNRAASDIADGINESFSGEFTYDGQTYTLATDVQHTGVRSMDDVTDSDHLFVIIDGDGESGRGITSMMGGKVMTLIASDYANDNWLSNTFSHNNTQSAVHEFGHAVGLTHETASGRNNLMTQYKNGTLVTPEQRIIMGQRMNGINRGPNSLRMGRIRVPYPYVHDIMTGESTKASHMLNWNKLFGRK